MTNGPQPTIPSLPPFVSAQEVLLIVPERQSGPVENSNHSPTKSYDNKNEATLFFLFAGIRVPGGWNATADGFN